MRNSVSNQVRISALAGVAALALAPAMAYAQSSDTATSGGGLENPTVEEIIVTGTILRGAAPVGSTIISVGQDKVQSSGATTSNELLATVPQVTNLFNTDPNQQLTIAANQLQVVRPNLRNLNIPTASSNSTLVLLDGHRIAPVGVTQNAVDPDLIPAAAIERVEIVTDGGSATYGADAVGGVINFITRKRFDGLQVDARYGFADNYQQVSANGIVGKDWGTGSVYLAYSYQHNDSLFGRDRDYIRKIDWNTGKATGLSCNPGNVQLSQFDIMNYLATGGIRYITTNYALPGLAANTSNTCDESDDGSFVPKATRHGAVAGLHQDLSDWLTVDAKAFYGERKSTSFSPFRGYATVTGGQSAIPQLGQSATTRQAFYMPVSAGSTATQQVFFTLAPLLGTNSARSSSEFQEWGANIEFAASLNDNWQLRTLLNYSRSNSEFHTQQLVQSLLTAAGSATDPQHAINFYDPAATPNQDLIRQVANGEQAGQAQDEVFNARSILDGTLLTLPGGDVKLAVGYEFLHDAFKQRTSPTDGLVGAIASQAYTPYSRDVNSLFGELQVPVVGAGNRMGGIYALTLAASVRYDHFSDFGGTTNPKFGLTYKPVSWVALRGNFSTSFNAPAPVDQLGSLRNTTSYYPINAFIRPGDTPSVTGTIAVQGSLANLKPQTAQTYSFGFDIDPPFIEGLHASLSYYHVDFKDRLQIPTPNSGIFTDFPNNVVSNPDGLTVAQLQAFAALSPDGNSVIAPIIASRCSGSTPASTCAIYELVDFRSGNYGDLKVSGLDFSANYRKATGFGGVDAAVSGNYQLSRKSRIGPGADVVDELDPGHNISRLQLQATLGADIGHFRAQATLNHSSGFKVIRSTNLPQDKVGDFNTVNLFFKYDVPADSVWLKDLSLTLNVNNVFDQDPPVYKNLGDNGYTNFFTLGRMVQLGISKKF
ncbi:TonB-dependent receptor (plasmid) [Novosphingobium sp. BL-8A]|uniref:TonB-dependent receptor domain-containing protein n=1 Tax=Novosphingobium sp. BL-8A TaxID=3127639 RepID=UPI0037569AC0